MSGPAHPSLDECANGFRIDETLHRWGVRFNEIVADCATDDYVRHCISCSTAYGFATVSIELTANAPDRPVTGLAYELGTSIEPKEAFARLVKTLGQPGEISRENVPQNDQSGGSVALYATWTRGPCSIGLSLYGGPRASEFGDSIGALYLTWTDIEAAAAPYLEPSTAATRVLADAAKEATSTLFEVEYPLFDPDYPAPSPSERALRGDGLLDTPAGAARRLGARTFALWGDKSGAWYLSTGRETIRLHGEATVHWHEIAPARGGGYSALQVGAWQVRDSFGSPAIAEAARLIGQVSGLLVERHTGHDV